MRSTPAVITLVPIEQKLFSQKKEQLDFIIEDDVRNALGKRLAKLFTATEDKIKILEEEMERDAPLTAKLKFKIITEGKKELVKYFTACAIESEMEKDDGFFKTNYNAYKAALNQIKSNHLEQELKLFSARTSEKSEVTSKEEIAINELEKSSGNICEELKQFFQSRKNEKNKFDEKHIAKELAEHKKLFEITIEESLKPFYEMKKQTQDSAFGVLVTNIRSLKDTSKDFQEYNIKRRKLELDLAILKSHCSELYKFLMTVCRKQFSLKDLQSERLFIEEIFSMDIKTLDDDGFTPLHFACVMGDVELVKKFLDVGADKNAKKKPDGYLPFQLLARHPYANSKQLLNMLISGTFSDFMTKDPEGRNAFEAAAFYGNQSMIEYLVPSIKVLIESYKLEQYNKVFVDALNWAAQNGHDGIIRKLIKTFHELHTHIKPDDFQIAIGNAFFNGQTKAARAFYEEAGYSLSKHGEDVLFKKLQELKDDERDIRIQNVESCQTEINHAIEEEQKNRITQFRSLKTTEKSSIAEDKIKPSLTGIFSETAKLLDDQALSSSEERGVTITSSIN